MIIYVQKTLKFDIISCMKHSQTKQPEDEVTEPTSTIQVHETTSTLILITTLPTTTEILTTSEPSTTTTLRIVDATLAVDKVEPRELISNYTHFQHHEIPFLFWADVDYF